MVLAGREGRKDGQEEGEEGDGYGERREREIVARDCGEMAWREVRGERRGKEGLGATNTKFSNMHEVYQLYKVHQDALRHLHMLRRNKYATSPKYVTSQLHGISF